MKLLLFIAILFTFIGCGQEQAHIENFNASENTKYDYSEANYGRLMSSVSSSAGSSACDCPCGYKKVTKDEDGNVLKRSATSYNPNGAGAINGGPYDRAKPHAVTTYPYHNGTKPTGQKTSDVGPWDYPTIAMRSDIMNDLLGLKNNVSPYVDRFMIDDEECKTTDYAIPNAQRILPQALMFTEFRHKDGTVEKCVGGKITDTGNSIHFNDQDPVGGVRQINVDVATTILDDDGNVETNGQDIDSGLRTHPNGDVAAAPVDAFFCAFMGIDHYKKTCCDKDKCNLKDIPYTNEDKPLSTRDDHDLTGLNFATTSSSSSSTSTSSSSSMASTSSSSTSSAASTSSTSSSQ